MAQPYVTVEKTNTPTATLTNITSVQLTKGRVKVSDNLRTGTATVTGRKPGDLPALQIGDTIQLTVTDPDTSTSVEFNYRLADLIIDYGIVSNMDTWTMLLEDAFAYLGRAVITRSWSSGTLAVDQAANVTNDVGIALITSGTGKSTVSAQTITDGNALEVFQNLVNTEQALVQAGDNDITWYNRGWQSTITYTNFADDGTANKYDVLKFAGLADNYADEVVVYPVGASAVSFGAGAFSYSLNSYSVDSATATDLAGYVKGVFDVQDAVPTVMSTLLNTASTAGPLTATGVGKGVNVKFRGTTYTALVEGFVITSDPQSTRITYYLSSAEFFSFLTLDDALLGKLDENKLGF